MTSAQETKKVFILFSLFLFFGCAALSQESALTSQPSIGLNNGQQTYSGIKEVLFQSGDRIDYDTLLWVHQEMILNSGHIPNSGKLIRMLIQKKNDHPRVDNMILIFAADIIGKSPTAIDGVAGLFEAMLMQNQRLNLWVLTYIGEAIGKYAYNMPEGDLLVDLLEKRVEDQASGSTPLKEFFGYHFIPPPRKEYIINYIAGIEDQETRVLERNCYYTLIVSEWSEAQIEKALRYLRTHAAEGEGENIKRPLKYLILNPGQFESLRTETR